MLLAGAMELFIFFFTQIYSVLSQAYTAAGASQSDASGVIIGFWRTLVCPVKDGAHGAAPQELWTVLA